MKGIFILVLVLLGLVQCAKPDSKAGGKPKFFKFRKDFGKGLKKGPGMRPGRGGLRGIIGGFINLLKGDEKLLNQADALVDALLEKAKGNPKTPKFVISILTKADNIIEKLQSKSGDASASSDSDSSSSSDDDEKPDGKQVQTEVGKKVVEEITKKAVEGEIKKDASSSSSDDDSPSDGAKDAASDASASGASASDAPNSDASGSASD